MFAMPDVIDMLPNKDEVLRQAGEALYYCQCFEGATAFALHVYKQICCEANPSWQMDQEIIRELGEIISEGWGFRKATLGRLLKELRQVVVIHPEADGALSKAVDVRNHFVHRYFLSADWEAVFGTGARHDVGPINEIIERMKTAHEVMGIIVRSLQRKLDEVRRESWGQGG